MVAADVVSLTKAVAGVQLHSQPEARRTDKQEVKPRTTSDQPAIDVESSGGSQTEVVVSGRKEKGLQISSTVDELSPPSSPPCDRDTRFEFLPRRPDGPCPVTITDSEPNNAFCFALTFINCSFSGDRPLRFENCIVECVTFTDCHFEETRFVNSVLVDMTVANVVFCDSWWTNRRFTQNFITIGRDQDDTIMFEGKREGLNDRIPAELRDSNYKEDRCGTQQQGDSKYPHLTKWWENIANVMKDVDEKRTSGQTW
ncbi:hypothetical protein CB0940_03113 [Cercospora beticola]|uniref:Uncharacterized protein n=1 Tax=Cercospora beticola TaxID=122368 RepID=A0A2G5I577_CERBT|nr:hypothetical protein CB0940_03113 [Cercospora beticola]PIA99959.1 hypothetical protein CB0940_03113 [Cercospora beticola]WPB00279.1 hypothetical protein RHO25_004898 [Cercospora beticola]CAK1361523.1 unnamed protein product [Cercospora beticola]